MDPTFTQSQLEAIAFALGDTREGLTGSEIGHLLAMVDIADSSPEQSKRVRLFNAFAESQNSRKHRRNILEFLRCAMRPERYASDPTRYEPLRANLNRALAFAGLAVKATGELVRMEQATTLSEAGRKAQELRADLTARGVHPDVLRFCRAELVADDYFHAVLEATKSIADKLRSRTGLTDDGSTLVDHALSGDPPLLAINAWRTDSEKSEQRGFANLVRGVFGMFRNPTAHAPRIQWAMEKADAEDLLTLASLIHRRLDAAHMPPRV